MTGVLDGSAIDLEAWLNQLAAFTDWIIVCEPFDAGTPTIRDLLPLSQAEQTLTKADVNDLVVTFINAVTSEVTFQDLVDLNGGQPLTSAQIQELAAAINAVAANTPNVTSSTTTYTYDACGD